MRDFGARLVGIVLSTVLFASIPALAADDLKAPVEAYAGAWEIAPSTGGIFTFELTHLGGGDYAGKFVNANGDPSGNGTLTGKVSPLLGLNIKFEQPAIGKAGSGVLRFELGDEARSKLHGVLQINVAAGDPQRGTWQGERAQPLQSGGGGKVADNSTTPTGGGEPSTGAGGNAPPGAGDGGSEMPADGAAGSGDDSSSPSGNEPPDGSMGEKTAKAEQDTDVYHRNDGKSEHFCTMYVGDAGTFVKEKPGEPDWVFLKGISGDCGGKDGWVWNGGSLSIQ